MLGQAQFRVLGWLPYWCRRRQPLSLLGKLRENKKPPDFPGPRSRSDIWTAKSNLLLFALLFALTVVCHFPLLRLPYFWDEAGYFVPAARDLLLSGDPIPAGTLSNAHPPLVMAWLASCWKLAGYSPLVTRLAMLSVSAFALLGVFRLARRVGNPQVALGSTLLTALYPVFFAQSSLAHLDMAAAAMSVWGLGSYVGGERWRAVAWFGVAGLAKETALVAPASLLLWELLRLAVADRLGRVAESNSGSGVRHEQRPLPSSAEEDLYGIWHGPTLPQVMPLALSALPLLGWLAYHYLRTGFVFGNPEYFRYNVSATIHPLRIGLALAQRIWQLFGYLNMFVLTGAAVLAMWLTRKGALPLRHSQTGDARDPGRRRIPLPIQLRFGAIVVGYLIAMSVVGGAVLARYLLPVYPLVIIELVSTVWRRLSWWKPALAAIAVAFAAGLWVYPPYRISPEDNLAYVDFVRLHQEAASKLEQSPHRRVLTAWPATDELRQPYLGYVTRPIAVVPIEHFSAPQVDRAARELRGQFDYALLFSTKYEPAHRLDGWWEKMQTLYFDYHRDLGPQAAAAILKGRIVHQSERGREWAAILRISPSDQSSGNRVIE